MIPEYLKCEKQNVTLYCNNCSVMPYFWFKSALDKHTTHLEFHQKPEIHDHEIMHRTFHVPEMLILTTELSRLQLSLQVIIDVSCQLWC